MKPVQKKKPLLNSLTLMDKVYVGGAIVIAITTLVLVLTGVRK